VVTAAHKGANTLKAAEGKMRQGTKENKTD